MIETILTAAVLLTNSNVLTSPHPIPASFEVSESGEVAGVTEDGRTFTQTNVVNDFTRLQKFQIDKAWWFVSDKGVIGLGDGISELTALSIYLAK